MGGLAGPPPVPSLLLGFTGLTSQVGLGRRSTLGVP